jgi:2-C-methyl-D-erythritol 4-phosphate cytidylyltransferase
MPSPDLRISAIVVAGGSGSRFGGLKQFMELGGTSVAARSIQACRAVADQVVLVAPEGIAELHGADVVVTGGPTRAASVRAGLAAIDEAADVVVVHDAARPLATERLFHGVVAEMADERVSGAICAVSITDTIKQIAEVEGHRRVSATLEREALVAVQTPQAFRVEALRAAHAHEAEATDDAALVEATGGIVVVVSGESDNVKLTSPLDLARAERFLAER